MVVNVGSLEKRSNQPKYKDKNEKSEDYCKADLIRLAIPTFFRFTDVTELM